MAKLPAELAIRDCITKVLYLAENFQFEQLSVLDRVRVEQIQSILEEALAHAPEQKEALLEEGMPPLPVIKKNSATIMIVDDDTDAIKLAKFFLAKQSFEVRGVTDPIAAIQSLQSGMAPNLIVLDLMMNQMTGFEFLVRMRELGLLEKIPVIVASGRGYAIDRVRCLEEGAKDYLEKPYNPEELVLRIRKLLAVQGKGESH